jgi:hypothetical protein
MDITLAAWATKNKISRQLAHYWVLHNILLVYRPAARVILIDEDVPVPKRDRPGAKKKIKK